MRTIKWLVLVIGIMAAILLTGCATKRTPIVQPVYVNGVGFAVDFADMRIEDDGPGLWQRYKDSWASAPWLMTGVHIGTAAGVYVVGDMAGWWGGSGSSRTENTTNNTRSQTTTDGWNVDMSGDGDGDRSFNVHVYNGAPENGNGF